MSIKLSIPEQTVEGDILQVKVLIAHPMETGLRRGMDGRAIPQAIIEELRCEYNGEVVFRAELHPAISANPYFAFYIRAAKSGDITLKWRDEAGEHAETRALSVT